MMMMMMKVKLWTLSGKLIAVKISLNNELYPTRLAGGTAKMSEAMDKGGRTRTPTGWLCKLCLKLCLHPSARSARRMPSACNGYCKCAD